MSAPPTGPRTEGGQHVSTEQGPRPHRVLVLNSGSSSVKYQLLDMADSEAGSPSGWWSGSARRPRGSSTRR